MLPSPKVLLLEERRTVLYDAAILPLLQRLDSQLDKDPFTSILDSW
jgi:hypothetical protein